MALIEYVKLWTEFLKDEWVLSLNCNERGAYLQLFLLAKMHDDSGLVRARSWHALSMLLACDVRTCRKIVAKFQSDAKIQLSFGESGTINIFINKYQEWQSLSPNKEGREKVKSNTKIQQNCGKNALLHRQIDRQIEKEEAPPPETETPGQTSERLLASFNAYIQANKATLVPFWVTNYAYVGGKDLLDDCVEEIRTAISTGSKKIDLERHYREKSWGDLLRNWNKNKIRSGEVK